MRISDWSSDVCSSDLAPAEFAEQVDRLQSRLCGHCRCAPELLDKVDIAGREIHVRGKGGGKPGNVDLRSEEHTSELQSLMRISYAVFCLKKQTILTNTRHTTKTNKVMTLKIVPKEYYSMM